MYTPYGRILGKILKWYRNLVIILTKNDISRKICYLLFQFHKQKMIK